MDVREGKTSPRMTCPGKNHRIFSGIDVGIINLGLCWAKVSGNYKHFLVYEIDCLDITKTRHLLVTKQDCTLRHSKGIYDRISHFVQETPQFEDCAGIAIERQPIMGHTSVEQILYGLLGEKTHLVHPRSMHKEFNIGHLTYDERKLQTTEISKQYMTEECLQKMAEMDRVCDIGDAVCLLLFRIRQLRRLYLKEKAESQAKEKLVKLLHQHDGNFEDVLCRFAYIPITFKRNKQVRAEKIIKSKYFVHKSCTKINKI